MALNAKVAFIDIPLLSLDVGQMVGLKASMVREGRLAFLAPDDKRPILVEVLPFAAIGPVPLQIDLDRIASSKREGI